VAAVERVGLVLAFPVVSTAEVVERGCVHLYLEAQFFMLAAAVPLTTEVYLVSSPGRAAQVAAQMVALTSLLPAQVPLVIQGVAVGASVSITHQVVAVTVLAVMVAQVLSLFVILRTKPQPHQQLALLKWLSQMGGAFIPFCNQEQ
jgi:hypothetical protein